MRATDLPARQIGEILKAEMQTTEVEDDIDPATLETMMSATNDIRYAFIATMRDFAASKQEAATVGRGELEPASAFILRNHIDRLFAAAGACIIDMRLLEAQAILASIDMVVELSRADDLRDELAGRLTLYEQQVTEMRLSLGTLPPPDLEYIREIARRARIAREKKTHEPSPHSTRGQT